MIYANPNRDSRNEKDEIINTFVVDTQGLYASETSARTDVRILVLSVLLSS